MVSVGQLVFLKVLNFNLRHGLEDQYTSLCHFMEIGVEWLLRCGSLLICQNGSRPPCWIRFTHVRTTHDEYLLVFVNVHNSVGIGTVVSMICKF